MRPTRIVDLQQLRLRGHRRPLEGARPARPRVQRPEPRLLGERVDLDDDAVDLVVELDARAAPSRAHAAATSSIDSSRSRERVGAEAVLAQPRSVSQCDVELEALAGADAVGPDRERPRRAVIDESFWRSEPAAALRGFGASFCAVPASRSFSSRKPESGM